MSEQKVKKCTERINSGEIVKVYFILNDEQTANGIAFSAVLKEIITSKAKIPAPCEPDEYPYEFLGEEATTWLKLEQLQPETNEHADDYIVRGTSLKTLFHPGSAHLCMLRK